VLVRETSVWLQILSGRLQSVAVVVATYPSR
jgi:hypothetical protein